MTVLGSDPVYEEDVDDVVRLREEGQTWAEIADYLGRPMSTVVSMHRAHVAYLKREREEAQAFGGDATPCAKCGLRGPHECLKGDAGARRHVD